MDDALMTAGIVIVTGLVVVFTVLVVLIFLIWAFGKIVTSITNRPKKEKSQPQVQDKAEVKAVSPSVKQATVSPKAEDGLSDEIVAVIAAAVASLSESTGVSYGIKSIRRANSGRPSWATVGVLENTRPF